MPLRRKQKRSLARFLLVAVAVGIGLGMARLIIWVDWTKWTISRCQRQLPSLSPEEAIRLLDQLGPFLPTSIPLLVQGLCDPRPQVAQAAQNQFQNLCFQWENQAWPQVCESLSLLARCLAEQKENLPPHSRAMARQLAQWILAWHPPEGSSARLQMIAHCEEVLAYLAALGPTGGNLAEHGPTGLPKPPPTASQALQGETSSMANSQQSSAELLAPSSRSASRVDFIDALAGFRLPGGGLPIEKLPGGISQQGAQPGVGFSANSASGKPASQILGKVPGSARDPLHLETVLRIRQPMEAEPFPRIAASEGTLQEGNPSAGSTGWLNRPVRLPKESPAKPEGKDISPAASPGQAEHRSERPRKSQAEKDPPTSSRWSEEAMVSKSSIASAKSPLGEEQLRQKEVRELLVLLAQGPKEDQQQVQAELARRGFGRVSKALAERLVAADPQVRLSVVRQLPALSGVESVAWLFWMCRDPDPQVRSAAVTLLATTKDPALLEALEEFLSRHPDERLRLQIERLQGLAPKMR